MYPNPSMLRLVWAVVVEEAPSRELLDLSDTALIAMLLQSVSRRMLLSGEETTCLYTYISSRIPLIRDLANRPIAPGITL